MPGRLARYLTDPAAFIDDCLPLNERGERWRLEPHQRPSSPECAVAQKFLCLKQITR